MVCLCCAMACLARTEKHTYSATSAQFCLDFDGKLRWTGLKFRAGDQWVSDGEPSVEPVHKTPRIPGRTFARAQALHREQQRQEMPAKQACRIPAAGRYRRAIPGRRSEATRPHTLDCVPS